MHTEACSIRDRTLLAKWIRLLFTYHCCQSLAVIQSHSSKNRGQMLIGSLKVERNSDLVGRDSTSTVGDTEQEAWPLQNAQEKMASTNASASNGWRSFNPSPTPTNFTGMPSSLTTLTWKYRSQTFQFIPCCIPFIISVKMIDCPYREMKDKMKNK